MDLARARKFYYLLAMMGPAIDTLLTGFYVVFVLHYLSMIELGLLFAFHLFVLAVADFPTGSLADLWGARKCLMASYGLFLCGYLGLALVIFNPSMALPLFILVQFLFAMGTAQESGTIVAWFTNQCKAKGGDLKKIRSIFGKARGITFMTITVAMLIGGFLAQYISLTAAFVAGIGLAVLALLATSLLESESSNSRKNRTNYLTNLMEAAKAAVNDSRLPILIATSSLNYAGYYIVIVLALQPLLYQDLRSFFWLSVVFAVLQIVSMLCSYIGGKITRFRDISTALLIWIVVPVVYFLLFVSILMDWGFYALFLGFAVLFGVFASYNPHILQFYQQLIPDDHRAAVTSLKSTARSMTAILFCIGGGILLQSLGMEILLLTASGLALVSLGLLFYIWWISST
ncbi:MAG: MFS transporter, partial [Candidatus Bathyarchaeota archaeon]